MEGAGAMEEDAELQAALELSMQAEGPGEQEEAEAVEPLKFRVTHRKDVLQLSMPPTATVLQLHLKLEELTGIQPTMQKVMFKGGLKDKTKTLQEVGIKNGVKMMLVGSKQDDVAKLKEAKAAVAKEPTAPPLGHPPRRRPRADLHLRCAVSGFTPAVCHGLGAVPRRVVCRDGVADGRVLYWFTLQYCKTYGSAPTSLSFLSFLLSRFTHLWWREP